MLQKVIEGSRAMILYYILIVCNVIYIFFRVG